MLENILANIVDSRKFGIDNIYLTSDTHFFHRSIIKYCHRPFLSVDDTNELARRGGKWHNGNWGQATWVISEESARIMNVALVEKIQQTVPSDGILIHLGDFAFFKEGETNAETYATQCAEICKKINRQMCICWGNHDWPDILRPFFAWSGHRGYIDIPGFDIKLVCDHYMGSVWDRSHVGAIQAYGHSHALVEDEADRLMPDRRNMDVGIDNAFRLLGDYRPFRLLEVVSLLASRPGITFNKDIPRKYKF